MQSMIGIVINYCTNDYPFLKPCIEKALKVSPYVIVVVSDCFFDGKKENEAKLLLSYEMHKNVHFVQIPYDIRYTESFTIRFWHNVSRWIGSLLLPPIVEHVLFLDVDEIINPDLFEIWLADENLEEETSYRFACYWYFRETRYQAKTFEESAVLIHRSCLNEKIMFTDCERGNIKADFHKNNVLSHRNIPMIHHYSWVRNKAEMLRKVQSWGHHSDRDWETLVNEEFQSEFRGKDFVHGYTYKEVKPFVTLCPVTPHPSLTYYPHVTYITPSLFKSFVKTLGFKYRVASFLM